jgi:hypothetical protein
VINQCCTCRYCCLLTAINWEWCDKTLIKRVKISIRVWYREEWKPNVKFGKRGIGEKLWGGEVTSWLGRNKNENWGDINEEEKENVSECGFGWDGQVETRGNREGTCGELNWDREENGGKNGVRIVVVVDVVAVCWQPMWCKVDINEDKNTVSVQWRGVGKLFQVEKKKKKKGGNREGGYEDVNWG